MGFGRPGPRGVPGHGRAAPSQPRRPQHPPAVCSGSPRAQGGACPLWFVRFWGHWWLRGSNLGDGEQLSSASWGRVYTVSEGSVLTDSWAGVAGGSSDGGAPGCSSQGPPPRLWRNLSAQSLLQQLRRFLEHAVPDPAGFLGGYKHRRGEESTTARPEG